MAFDVPNRLPQEVPLAEAEQLVHVGPVPPPMPQHYQPQALVVLNSNEQSFVLFHNTTTRFINLYWIDYSGRRSFYTILRPNATIKANTFVTHPWLFRDSQTGEFMQVEKQEVFWPKLYKIPHPTLEGQWIVGRRKIDIHLPLDLLSNRCLWIAAQRLRKQCGGKLMLDHLPVPATLIKQLKEILYRIRHFESNGGVWIQAGIEGDF